MNFDKNKRKAFIGLSSPLGYDYQNQASKVAGTTSSPNPILDSPYGLLLLFDEIIFLSRILCPENMRKLPYVRFLDEEGWTPSEKGKDWESLRQRLESDPFWKEVEKKERQGFVSVMENAGVRWPGVDKHTHSLTVGSLEAFGNPSPDRLLLDFLILEELGDRTIELITNSFTQPLLASEGSAWAQGKLTQNLTIRNIHNYLMPQGPYHPSVDEVRASKYLVDFRKWIVEKRVGASETEISEIQEEVENALQEAEDTVFLKYLDRKHHFVSVGKAAIGDGVGILIPGASTVMSIVEETVRYQKNKEQRWQGFVVDARSKFRSK